MELIKKVGPISFQETDIFFMENACTFKVNVFYGYLGWF